MDSSMVLEHWDAMVCCPKADIGIAVVDAIDAARSESNVTLTKPGLSVIISAVLISQ
ncbi:hypothetical protein Drorol1_Dr00020404, partial [Drosera rotundifolia]